MDACRTGARRIGLGGAMPNVISLAYKSAPVRKRGAFIPLP
jgi:hypothetical protein